MHRLDQRETPVMSNAYQSPASSDTQESPRPRRRRNSAYRLAAWSAVVLLILVGIGFGLHVWVHGHEWTREQAASSEPIWVRLTLSIGVAELMLGSLIAGLITSCIMLFSADAREISLARLLPFAILGLLPPTLSSALLYGLQSRGSIATNEGAINFRMDISGIIGPILYCAAPWIILLFAKGCGTVFDMAFRKNTAANEQASRCKQASNAKKKSQAPHTDMV